MQDLSPVFIYKKELENLRNNEEKLQKRKKLLSYQRFALGVLSFLILWKLWNFSILFALAGFILFFSLFLFIVFQDLKNKESLENVSLLQNICKQELRILDHDFLDLPDGNECCPMHHAYAQDLDLFGKASLYQYINRTHSEQGRQQFADWLLNPTPFENIVQRQKATAVLCHNQEWCRQFRAFGIKHPLTLASQQKINAWLEDTTSSNNNSWLRIVRYLFPIITVSCLLLFLFGILHGSLFTFLVILFFLVASFVSKKFLLQYNRLTKIVAELETLEQSSRMIETNTFDNELLIGLKNKMGSLSNRASFSIDQLKKILSRLDYRFNPIVHIPLNSFFLWDLQQIISLEKWKTKYRNKIPFWYEAFAETESLVSLGTLAFNHPNWSYPQISHEKNVFIGTDIGHPLIKSSNRVVNSFSSLGVKQINLVTGSNMSGKSTFLRSVGVNIVLAMMGAPVCCRQLTVSAMKVISSMRVNDNLEENTSTFYAELKKLKEIIEAVKRQDAVFILLDEILRGTNSADRHTGSDALLKQLIRENASGIIATHDLELSKLEVEFPGNFHNFHFDVQVKHEDLYFDYKIKEGICRSMNASLLMKKIGIEI